MNPFTPRPLPVRLAPIGGESWLGYTHRVASTFGCSWSELMSPLLGSADTAKARWHAGVCVSEESARRLAAHFRLTVDEVQTMHLDRVFGQSALHTAERVRDEFDPFAEERVGDHARLTQCGPIPNRQQQPVCHPCRDGNPHWLPVDWRLAWLPVCEEHQLVLARAGAVQAVADEELISAQREVRSHLSPNEDNAFFFEHLTVVVDAMLGRSTPQVAAYSPDVLAPVLPAAVRVVTTAGFPDSQCLTRGRRRMSRTPAEVLQAPRTLGRRRRSVLDVHPRRLPMSLFSGAISDYLGPAMLESSRVVDGWCAAEEVAAVTTAMTRFGMNLHDATASGYRDGPRALPRFRQQVVEVLASIERTGHLEDYWTAAHTAAVVLDRENINYGQRRELLTDDDFVARVLADTDRPHRAVRDWLVTEWAGETRPPHWGPSHEPLGYSYTQDITAEQERRLHHAAKVATRKAA